MLACAFSQAQQFVMPADAPTTEGLKKIDPDDVLNQLNGTISVGGGYRTESWQNLFLAFAIDVRYRRECYAGKQTALCNFLHSSISTRQSLTWAAPVSEKNASMDNNYEIVFIPLEYVTGSFAKTGPAMATTNSALIVKAGARAELLRELGLSIQNRFTSVASGEINYVSPAQPLSELLAFRWIGSMRLFFGAESLLTPSDTIRPLLGAETNLGLALDVEQGTISVSDTIRHDGDFKRSLTQNSFELKYLRAVCKNQNRCELAHSIDLGGGVRYDSWYFDRQDVQRIIFLIEISRL